MRSEIIIHPDEISKKWIDRIADSGISVMGIHPVGGEPAARMLAALVGQMQTSEYRELIDYARARGVEIEYELHAAGYLMPRELFPEHPEYFRMNEHGERVTDYNFCISNAEAMKIFTERAAKLALSLYGSSKNFYFWMDDGKNIHCHCERCRALSPSDQQLVALNGMLGEIRKYIPDARMAYLAYMDTLSLPTSISPAEGIFLEYAPIEKYRPASEDTPMLIKHERDMLRPLMKFFGKDSLKVLEYWYDNSLYSGWKKPPKPFTPDPDAIKNDIAEYRAMGFDSVATFACFLGDDYEKLHGDVDITPFANNVK